MPNNMQKVGSSMIQGVKHNYTYHTLRTLAIGAGITFLAPVVLPLAKPLAKTLIKGGVTLYEKSKVAITETGEVIGDIVAEAKAEVATEQAKKASVAAGLMAAPTLNNETHHETQVN
ncbi:MAG: DUF5132 domain-containing protein [Xenococcus sp. (in: cyanobacteria)]